MRKPADRCSTKLSTLYIEIFYGCNYRCAYCYAGEYNRDQFGVAMSSDLLTSTLAEARRQGVREIIYLGGEPTLHPRLASAVATAAESGFESVGIVSNGSHFDDCLAAEFARHGAWVNLTMRGASPEAFNANARHPNAWNHFWRAIETASRHGLSIGIEYDILPSTYRDLYSAIARVHAVSPIGNVQCHRNLPRGDARNGHAGEDVSIENWREVLTQAHMLRSEFGLEVYVEDGLPLCLFDREHWDEIRPCTCGRTSATVSPDGGIRACACESDSRQDGLAGRTDIGGWSRSTNHPACRDCPLLARCGGGCPSSAPSRHAEAFADRLVTVANAV